MYKVQITNSDCNITEFNNAQLICSYYYLKKTFNHLYKRKLRNLSKEEKKAIIYDIALFEAIKEKNYTLRCVSPQKWFENWKVFIGITDEIKKRQLIIN